MTGPCAPNLQSMLGEQPARRQHESGERGRAPRWRFLLLGRIANFALLRRHVGRARADRLAGELAVIIRRACPEGRVGPIASDTVEIVLESRSRETLDNVLTTLKDLFSREVEFDEESLEIDFLLGAAAANGPVTSDVRMIEQAELALRQASGDRRSVVRDADSAQETVDRIALARDLSRAIDQDELFLQYQPKLHVRRQRIAGVEALIRWNHPERGLVSPGDFIPIAEETRAIMPLTLWTIRQALVDQAALAQSGHDLRIFVNIAGALLCDARFVDEACALVRGKEDKIGFEITETSVIRDPESAIANLKAFADLGVEIAIDDYGAGLSSLAYLKRLPARELKIDKLFVTQLTSSNRDPLIVRSTIDLAHALEMEVVAEGVETQAALALLSVMGCDMIQGFLISRPVGLDALIEYLNDGRHAGIIEHSRATFNGLAATWKRG